MRKEMPSDLKIICRLANIDPDDVLEMDIHYDTDDGTSISIKQAGKLGDVDINLIIGTA